jgi:hypothetical protein
MVRKPEGKSHLERPRRRWVDNIKMDPVVIGWSGLVHDKGKWRAVVNSVMNLPVP